MATLPSVTAVSVRDISRSESRPRIAKASAPAPDFYRPELDAARFIGFLLIFFGHTHTARPEMFGRLAQWPEIRHLFVIFNLLVASAVPAFFMLSAYVITALLMRERERRSTIHIKLFYLRRMLRIWPLYMSMLLVSFTVALLVNHNASPRMLIAGALMVGNWTVLLKLSDYAPLALYHLWSVSVEEQFYLFFPFAAKYLSRRWMQAGCIAIIVVGLASLHFRAGESAGQIWKDSIPNFIFFAAGVLVALQFPAGKMPDLATGWRALLGALGCITIFLTEGLPILASTPAGRSGSVLIATYAMRMIGMVCILIAILGIRCYIPRVLVYLGQISFGLYMFHVWAIALATKLMGSSHVDGMPITFPRDGLALTLTILMAMASFHLLELPFLKLKDRFAIIRSRPTTVNATEVSVS